MFDAKNVQSEEGRRALGQVATMILETWGLQPAEQAMMLGLQCDLVTRLPSYRIGAKPLPPVDDVVERASRIVEIYRMLGLAFPGDCEERYAWVRQPNRRFCAGRLPIDMMLDGGLPAIEQVERVVQSLLR